MPFYTYVCSSGHAHDEHRTIMDRNRPAKCDEPGCRRRAKRELVPCYLTVIPDFREHWHPGLEAVVKNRAHFEQLKKERGQMDFDPKDSANQPSSGWQG